MSKYIKDGKIYNKITQLKYNGRIYLNPPEEIILVAGYEIYNKPEKTEEELLADAKEEKIDFATRYGTSPARNSYIASGYTLYVPAERRANLRSMILAAYAEDVTIMHIWYEGYTHVYTTARWEQYLNKYEVFLYNVYCIMNEHIQNINALTSVEAVEAYDYTTGYPDIINYDIDVRTDEEKLADAISEKIEALELYVESDDKQGFKINDITIVLNSESRNKLRNIINSEIVMGDTNLTEWYNGVSYTYTLEEWDRYLSQYEIYLHNVTNVMEQHKVNIRSLTTIDDVNNYDYTTGYPTQLSF